MRSDERDKRSSSYDDFQQTELATFTLTLPPVDCLLAKEIFSTKAR